MGGSLSTAERRRALRKINGHADAAHSLCVDEERTYMGGPRPLDHRDTRPSTPEVFARQRALLAKLIGGKCDLAESIATRLLSTFGSVGGVLTAQPAALARIVDCPELVERLAAARPVVVEGLGEEVHRTRFELTDIALQQWIVSLFKGLRRERIHLALLDGNKRLIFDEQLSEGDLRCVTGNLRNIVSTGISFDATGVVLMHNHPSGNAHPSAADVKETRRIAFLLENLDLCLEDHLIVSGNSIFSMRGAMLL